MTRAVDVVGEPPPPPPRSPKVPGRPPAVELAAAILIVGGAVNLIGAVLATASSSGPADPFLWLTVLVNVASVGLGLATRFGRLWLVTVNYAAILAFLDLLGASVNAAALMLGLAEILVVIILIRHKPWFDERGRPPGVAGTLGPPAAEPGAGSALHAADREAADEVALEDEEHDRDG
jgi:hypothetical protein